MWPTWHLEMYEMSADKEKKCCFYHFQLENYKLKNVHNIYHIQLEIYQLKNVFFMISNLKSALRFLSFLAGNCNFKLKTIKNHIPPHALPKSDVLYFGTYLQVHYYFLSSLKVFGFFEKKHLCPRANTTRWNNEISSLFQGVVLVL